MMIKKQIDIELKITFDTPFIVGSGFGLAALVDSRTVKDRENIVYLPASSVKGKIRSEFKKLMEALSLGSVCNSIISGSKEICKTKKIEEACAICRIFGSEFYESNLIFEDAVPDDMVARGVLHKIDKDRIIPSSQSSVRTGIKINRFLKTAEEKALFTIEGVNPAFTFKSGISGSCYVSDEEYSYFKGTIETITHLGGIKARGMGRCSIVAEERSK